MNEYLNAETMQAAGMEVVLMGRSTVDGRVAPWSARTDAVLRWVGWHLGEIAVVGGSAVLGLVWHPWWWALTVPTAAGWVAHERTTRRRTRTGAREVVMPAAAATGPADDDQSGDTGTGREVGRGLA